jgi:hypothetical protein
MKTLDRPSTLSVSTATEGAAQAADFTVVPLSRDDERPASTVPPPPVSRVTLRREGTAERPTCRDQEREHAWESRGRLHRMAPHLFACKTCGAWGWAPPRQASLIRVYKNALLDPRTRGEAPELTALTADARRAADNLATAEDVDRRAAPLPRKRGKAWYTPRFELSDWDREPTGGERRRGARGGRASG